MSAEREAALADARHYLGLELDLFVDAHAWRRYWASFVRPQLGRRVLEVGAGIGSSTLALWQPAVERWLAVEPDPALAQRLEQRLQALGPARPAIHRGTLASLPAGERFDTVLYIDVLEHLEDDAAEVAAAVGFLAPGGRLIVLSPAHPWLFSPFDAAIGHFRRYTRRGLRQLLSPHLTLERVRNLDSLGVALSLGNRLLLRRAAPTARQIAFWNRAVVPLSPLADPLLLHRLERSVVAIARRPSCPGRPAGPVGVRRRSSTSATPARSTSPGRWSRPCTRSATAAPSIPASTSSRHAGDAGWRCCRRQRAGGWSVGCAGATMPRSIRPAWSRGRGASCSGWPPRASACRAPGAVACCWHAMPPPTGRWPGSCAGSGRRRSSPTTPRHWQASAPRARPAASPSSTR